MSQSAQPDDSETVHVTTNHRTGKHRYHTNKNCKHGPENTKPRDKDTLSEKWEQCKHCAGNAGSGGSNNTDCEACGAQDVYMPTHLPKCPEV